VDERTTAPSTATTATGPVPAPVATAPGAPAPPDDAGGAAAPPAAGSATASIDGLRRGTYPVTVDGEPGGELVAGDEPGP
jgi:hypothetical protein